MSEGPEAHREPRGYELGLSTLSAEVDVDVEVKGSVPDWLRGTFVHVGPAKFEDSERPLRHWIDGFAMLHRFSFDDGYASYRNRSVRGRAATAVEQGGRLRYREFATDPPRPFYRRLASMVAPVEASDNCNHNIVPYDGGYAVVGATFLMRSVDLMSLETQEIKERPPGQIVVPHPRVDKASGDVIGLATSFGAKNAYRIYSSSPGRGQNVIASIPTKKPAFIHSFGMTEGHIVVAEFPYVANPMQIALGSGTIVDNFAWEPDRGTVFHVIDRRTKTTKRFEGEPWFGFHLVNAFAQDSYLVVDAIVYEDPTIVDQLYLEALKASPPTVNSLLRRFRIPLPGGATDRVVSEAITEWSLELPRMNASREGQDYRYVYALRPDPGVAASERDLLNEIVKLDLQTGEAITWRAPGCYPSEPTFVAEPDAVDEDEGILLSIVLDSREGRSFLLILDARDLSERGKAQLPHHVPLGFHGEYFA